MYGEYGYMEEGHLGKSFNFRLLKRLARYATPYKKIISLALSLTILITLLQLTLPYLSKIAIDRYILSSWYQVHLSAMEETDARNFVKKYGHILEKTEDGSSGFIFQMDLKKMDPSVISKYRVSGIISEKRFYKTSPDVQNSPIFNLRERNSTVMEDGSIVIPLENLNKLEKKEILKIRE